MRDMTVKDVVVEGGTISDEEKQYYIDLIEKAHPDVQYERLEVKIDGGMTHINAIAPNTPLDRIRRITGYIVGTLNKFNNAKREEEKSRVKHGLSTGR